jgi:hypothetical protein
VTLRYTVEWARAELERVGIDLVPEHRLMAARALAYAIRTDGGPAVPIAELMALVDDLLDTDGGGTR